MATVRTVTVKSSGGDYTSLSNAEAGEQADLPTLDRQLNIECYASAAPDTTAVEIDGWTTDATRYISIYVPVGERHDGKYNTSKYRLESHPAVDVLHIAEQYVRVSYLQIFYDASPAGNFAYGTWLSTTYSDSDVRISNCIIKRVAGLNKVGAGIELSGLNLKAWNNVIYDFDTNTSACGIYCKTSNHYLYNNTIINCYTGINGYNGTTTAKNNIVKGSGNTNAYVGTFTSSDYNATDGTDTGDGGVNSHTSHTFTFVDEAGDDFHLASGDTGAKDLGVSDPASGLFSDDIDGQTRSGSWDIGADEYVAAGGGPGMGSGVMRGMNRGAMRGMAGMLR